jgi:hypothetical protein
MDALAHEVRRHWLESARLDDAGAAILAFAPVLADAVMRN